MTGSQLCDRLRSLGCDFFTGVPDSTLKALFRHLEDRPELGYVPAVSEEAALGLAVGAHLGGRFPAVLMQSSGFGTSVNALASLVLVYRIPMLLVIGWRGHDGHDAPEHLLMGGMTLDLLRRLGMPFEVLEPATIAEQAAAAVTARREATAAALVVRRGTLAS